MSRSSSCSNAAMMPRPAQPTPGLGPPHSTQSTPPLPSKTMSSSSGSGLSLIVSRTVGILRPATILVESALGSHPICITFSPRPARAAETFPTVVDFPIPPFP